MELWAAMEATESHPLKEMAVRQLTSYREACDSKNNTKDQPGSSPSPKTPASSAKKDAATPAATTPAETPASNKRPAPASASTTSSKRQHVAPPPLPIPAQTWRHLDEVKVLEFLPENLRSLVHLRHMAIEIQSADAQLVEDCYQRALSEFLEKPIEGKTMAQLFELSQSLLLLWRFAKRLSKTQECKSISYAYHAAIQEYVQAQPNTTVTTI